MKNSILKIYGIDSNNLACCEALGFGKCFTAYADILEDIQECGFNPNSGYTYIALENGICICSAFGRDVEYLVTDFETGEEHFFETYESAEDFWSKNDIIVNNP